MSVYCIEAFGLPVENGTSGHKKMEEEADKPEPVKGGKKGKKTKEKELKLTHQKVGHSIAVRH